MFAVIGVELANILLSKGFEMNYIKEGKYTNVYYFTDSEELHAEVEKYLYEKEKLC